MGDNSRARLTGSMPHPNYTAIDLTGTLLASLLFAAVLVPPGYVLAWATNLAKFRTLEPRWRFLLSVPLGIAVCPITIYLLDFVYTPLVWCALAVSWLIFILLWSGQFGHVSIRSSLRTFRVPVAAVVIVLAWGTVAIGSLIDLQFHDRLDPSNIIYDHSLRTSMIDAITRTSFSHPSNPFYHINGPSGLRYHFFWFMLCSLVDRLGGSAVDGRQALIASVVWCGLGLMCLILCYLRWFSPTGEQAMGRRSRIAIGLLLVTGLDFIPTVLLIFFRAKMFADMEWWNVEEVTSWADSFLWVPNHVGSLAAGLTAFLVFVFAGREPNRSRAFALTLVGAAAVATTMGCSIYVGFTFALILTVWTVVTFVAGWRRHTAVLVAAGVLAILFVLPYLKQLAGPGGGGGFLVLSVRSFPGFGEFFNLPDFSHEWQRQILNLALLPLNYSIELGFFLVVGIAQIASYWRQRRNLEQAAVLCILAVSLLVATFVRSVVITTNDLGMRGFLPAQFVLLLWGADWLWHREKLVVSERSRGAVQLLLLIGVAGTMYQLALLRFSAILSDVSPFPSYFFTDHKMGLRTMGNREVYDSLKAQLPANAVVEFNSESDIDYFEFGLFSSRPAFAVGKTCGTEFGGDMDLCKQVFPQVSDIFRLPSLSEQDVSAMCQKFGISALVVNSIDPVWSFPDSWIWKAQPVAANEFARAYVIKSVNSSALGQGRSPIPAR